MSSNVAINFQQAMTITAMQHLLACKQIPILIATIVYRENMMDIVLCFYYNRSFKQNKNVALNKPHLKFLRFSVL